MANTQRATASRELVDIHLNGVTFNREQAAELFRLPHGQWGSEDLAREARALAGVLGLGLTIRWTQRAFDVPLGYRNVTETEQN